jgi:hypothetical protein
MRKKAKTKQFDYGISRILEQTHKQIDTKEEPKEWPSFVLSRNKRKKGEIVYHPLFYKIFND